MKKAFILLGTLLLTASSVFAYSMPRWGMTSVDVYLPEHQYSGMVRSAFEQWSEASGHRIKFRYYTTRFASNNAPIRVEFSDEEANYVQVSAKRTETTGYFTNMDDGFINRGRLVIYKGVKHQNRKREISINTLLLHEVGYILGMDKKYSECQDGGAISIMCAGKLSEINAITPQDKTEMVKKYDRSSGDIKDRKQKPKD